MKRYPIMVCEETHALLVEVMKKRKGDYGHCLTTYEKRRAEETGIDPVLWNPYGRHTLTSDIVVREALRVYLTVLKKGGKT